MTPSQPRARRFARLAAPLMALATAFAAAPALADDAVRWELDPARSILAIAIDMGSGPLYGRFTAWSAEIEFDPERPEAGRVSVKVGIGSVVLEDDMATKAAPGPRWLDAKGFPEAEFEGSGFERTEEEGRWTLPGTLSLKGIERPLILDVTLSISGELAEAEIKTEITRDAWGVGPEEKDEVGLTVRLAAHVEARRIPDGPPQRKD